MAMTPNVLDISHHQVLEPDGFEKMKAAGVLGVIHKSSEGTGFVDKQYAKRRRECEAAGLLWGAYHFATNASPEAQVEHFVRSAKPDANTLLCLDWEDYGKRSMTAVQARRFLNALMAKTGRTPKQIKVYGGNTLKERITAPDDVAYFSQFDLWLCHYTTKNKVRVPKAWDKWWLWQYSDTGHVAGIKADGKVDCNLYEGADLAGEWAGGSSKLVAVPEVIREPTKNPVTPTDLVPVSRKAWRTTWIVRTLHALWMGFTFDQVLAWFGIAQETRQQVETFVSDHATVLIITGAIVGALALKGVLNLMADDVNEGRATPSGGLPAAQ